jgi:hypothetical protein
MKQRFLLSFVMILLITGLKAQKKDQRLTGFAITALEKGGRGWKEVRQVDMVTGEELKSIYRSADKAEALNARTGKPVQVKEVSPYKTTAMISKNELLPAKVKAEKEKKVVNLDQEVFEKEKQVNVHVYVKDLKEQVIRVRAEKDGRVVYVNGMEKIQSDKPFATNSAAMAYDKKHERLYYTPMGINQLRYIDLKSGKIYYFEDEAFGKVSGMHDGANQITRMVIASDGNGYALTNDGNNLIRFTTGKNPVISELGAITDEVADSKASVHSRNGYGGDMIADANGNLYLIQANRNVFRINIESRSAKWLGAIKGLPQGFSTNGAMVEGGSKVIVASSESTVGYFRFDLNTLQAEKVSGSPDVFNASDLANGVLAFDKEKKRKEKKNEEAKEETRPVETVTVKKIDPSEMKEVTGISVYPNPVTTGIAKLSFEDQPAGRYQVQVFDLDGKQVISQEVIVQNKLQVAELKIPEVMSRGTYLVKIFNEANRITSTTKLVVQ